MTLTINDKRQSVDMPKPATECHGNEPLNYEKIARAKQIAEQVILGSSASTFTIKGIPVGFWPPTFSHSAGLTSYWAFLKPTGTPLTTFNRAFINFRRFNVEKSIGWMVAIDTYERPWRRGAGLRSLRIGQKDFKLEMTVMLLLMR